VALKKSSLPKSFIFISTIAVYGCETGEEITKEHPLNGDSPYALSKIQAEQFKRVIKRRGVHDSKLRMIPDFVDTKIYYPKERKNKPIFVIRDTRICNKW
jgi:dTDP-4-dehydrorhamnose reductase